MVREPVSIVVPVKNRATLVLRTLESIRQQTWRPLRVIVVDNASTDGTPGSVRAWAEKHADDEFEVSVIEESTPGAAAARNAGLESVDTRLMMFFDSDDLMAPRHVETIMRRFHAGDDPDLVFYRMEYHPVDGADRITKRPGCDLMTTHIAHGMLRTAAYACETALARRAGGWNETLRGWDDLEFGSRLLMEARRRAYIPDVNVEVYAQVDSITGTEFTSRKGEWERALDAMEANFGKSRHRNREKWSRLVAYKRAILAAFYWREGAKEAGDALLEKALSTPGLNSMQKAYLTLAYNYTALGGRGAAVLANLLL